METFTKSEIINFWVNLQLEDSEIKSIIIKKLNLLPFKDLKKDFASNGCELKSINNRYYFTLNSEYSEILNALNKTNNKIFFTKTKTKEYGKYLLPIGD